MGAIVTAAVAARMRQLWWTDPAGGILISALIIYRWSVITAGSVAKVVRRLAAALVHAPACMAPRPGSVWLPAARAAPACR